MKEPFILELPKLAPSRKEIADALQQLALIREQHIARIKAQDVKIRELRELIKHLCATRDFFAGLRESEPETRNEPVPFGP